MARVKPRVGTHIDWMDIGNRTDVSDPSLPLEGRLYCQHRVASKTDMVWEALSSACLLCGGSTRRTRDAFRRGAGVLRREMTRVMGSNGPTSVYGVFSYLPRGFDLVQCTACAVVFSIPSES